MTVNIIFQRRGGTLLSSDFWYKIKFLLTISTKRENN